ncbi:hypothetical protein B0F88_11867 [Methylobacter tundripaludum]|uniref:Uncharacterized protein n=1 Tax=Methylobacter tundripaludum TaxID=173365 RepID=A0A2S6GLE2_9GAMM|nr:hypothetical protein [Methylobacter tundripaludum]PPK66035.1 hypothetical protein B0F88_11867 [Methylobacter tundripaludum]
MSKSKRQATPQRPDEGKRKFLRDAGMLAVSALLTRPMDKVCVVVSDLIDTVATAGERAALASIVDVNRGIQLFAGNTNKLAAVAGTPGISPYLRSAAKSFGAFAITALGDAKHFERVSEEDARLALDDKSSDLILLGGPVANSLGAKFTAHNFVQVNEGDREILLPIFNHSNGLRWGFYCGSLAYGSWGDKVRKARRYENGEEVERPLYGLWDLKESRKHPQPFFVDGDGFLQEEALLITRVSNPYSRVGTITTIGGVHGYSAQAFFSQSDANLKQLLLLTHGASAYQVMVPVRLLHDHSIRHTSGQVDWNGAKIVITAA